MFSSINFFPNSMVAIEFLNNVDVNKVLEPKTNKIYIVKDFITITATLTCNNSVIYILNGQIDIDIESRAGIWVAPGGRLISVPNTISRIGSVNRSPQNPDEFVVSTVGNNKGVIISGGLKDYTVENFEYLKNYPAQNINKPTIVSGIFELEYLGKNPNVNLDNISFQFLCFIGLQKNETQELSFRFASLTNSNSFSFFNSSFHINDLYMDGIDAFNVLSLYDQSNITVGGSGRFFVVSNQRKLRSGNIFFIDDLQSSFEILELSLISMASLQLSGTNIVINGNASANFQPLEKENNYLRCQIVTGGVIFTR